MNLKLYYVSLSNGTKEGPYKEKELAEMFQQGKYPAGTLIWCHGMETWARIETVFRTVHSGAMPEDMPPVPPSMTSAADVPPPPVAPRPVRANAVREYYLMEQGNEKSGPYSEEELNQFVTDGRILNNHLIWKEGMKQWHPLQFTLPNRPISTYFNAGLWTVAGLFVAAVVIFFLGAIFSIPDFYVMQDPDGIYRRYYSNPEDEVFIFSFMGFILITAGSIMLIVRSYKAWTCIQDLPSTTGRPSAAQAIGLLFVPLFNFFWAFLAFGKISTYGNMLLQRHKAIPQWPFMSYAISGCAYIFFNFIFQLIAGSAETSDERYQLMFLYPLMHMIYYTMLGVIVFFTYLYLNKLIFMHRGNNDN